jgi:hypothetical protein
VKRFREEEVVFREEEVVFKRIDWDARGHSTTLEGRRKGERRMY